MSAAAGSGKTAVLIERITRLVIDEKTDIDRFLITTFTNAAAAEMKSRLEKAISKQMDEPGADRSFLRRQLSMMPRANISTFHTFALEVMRRYFYLTDLEPGFSIGDDVEVSIMKNDAAARLFDGQVRGGLRCLLTFPEEIQQRQERRADKEEHHIAV